MGNEKPKFEVRKPDERKATDGDAVTAFINGEDAGADGNAAADAKGADNDGEATATTDDADEGSGKERVTAYIPDELDKRLRIHVALSDDSLSSTIEQALAAWLEEHGEGI